MTELDRRRIRSGAQALGRFALVLLGAGIVGPGCINSCGPKHQNLTTRSACTRTRSELVTEFAQRNSESGLS